MPTANTAIPLADLPDHFARHLDLGPYSEHTKRAYASAARRYVEWLAASPKWQYLALLDSQVEADGAAHAYREHLLRQAKRSPKTVDAAMTAIGALYQYVHLDRPGTERAADDDGLDPQALDEDQVAALLRAARRQSVRDHALLALLYGTAIRVSEATALDVDDVALAEHRGVIEVRYGKGGKPRRVPVAPVAIKPVREWLRVRVEEHGLPGHEGALFVSRGSGRNRRLSERSVRHIVTTLGERAGLPDPIGPHVLRHTALTRMAREGVDVTTLAKVAGHRSVRTTQRYTTPKSADLDDAVAHLTLNY